MSTAANLVSEAAPLVTVNQPPKSTKFVNPGLWQEDSFIDRIDKAVSIAVFTLEFGYLTELLLLAPGTWFGLPVPCFLLANFFTLFSSLATEEGNVHEVEDALLGRWEFAAISVLCILLWSILFFSYLVSGNIEKAYLLNKHLIIPSMVVPVWMGKIFNPVAFKSATFFISSWLIAQAVSSALKTIFSRMRPTVSESTSKIVHTVDRAFPSYRTLLSIGESSIESFPSGDSVGAACFSCTSFLIGGPVWLTLLCVLTAFCRMYFHAHHFLDVFVGLLLGWGVPLLIYYFVGIDYFDATRLSAVFVIFIVFVVQLQKLKPELPSHLQVKGRKGF